MALVLRRKLGESVLVNEKLKITIMKCDKSRSSNQVKVVFEDLDPNVRHKIDRVEANDGEKQISSNSIANACKGEGNNQACKVSDGNKAGENSGRPEESQGLMSRAREYTGGTDRQLKKHLIGEECLVTADTAIEEFKPGDLVVRTADGRLRKSRSK